MTSAARTEPKGGFGLGRIPVGSPHVPTAMSEVLPPRSVWYTVEGTGGELTVDTAKSNFDTVLAVYVMDGDGLVEDRVQRRRVYEPIGSSLRLDHRSDRGGRDLQNPGWRIPGWFDPSLVDSGRLKVSIE